MSSSEKAKTVSEISRAVWELSLAGIRLRDAVSDRQWRDVLGIILTQEGRLDTTYLKQGADALGVSDLLQRALSQARGE